MIFLLAKVTEVPTENGIVHIYEFGLDLTSADRDKNITAGVIQLVLRERDTKFRVGYKYHLPFNQQVTTLVKNKKEKGGS